MMDYLKGKLLLQACTQVRHVQLCFILRFLLCAVLRFLPTNIMLTMISSKRHACFTFGMTISALAEVKFHL